MSTQAARTPDASHRDALHGVAHRLRVILACSEGNRRPEAPVSSRTVRLEEHRTPASAIFSGPFICRMGKAAYLPCGKSRRTATPAFCLALSSAATALLMHPPGASHDRRPKDRGARTGSQRM